MQEQTRSINTVSHAKYIMSNMQARFRAYEDDVWRDLQTQRTAYADNATNVQMNYAI